jgi:hypothetical protein
MDQDLVGPGINHLDVVNGGPLEGVERLEEPVPCILATARSSFRPVTDRYDFLVLVVEHEPGRPVAPLNGFERLTHDLDVLLRHRLLRQPGGFEGLLNGPIFAHLDSLSLAHLPHVRFGEGDLLVGPPNSPPEDQGNDDVLAPIK